MLRRLMAMAVVLVLSATANAQMFEIEDSYGDFNPRVTTETPTLPPGGDSDFSGYTPLGGGMLLLAALGGAYALKKGRKGSAKQ